MLLFVTLSLFSGVPVFGLDIPPLYAKILDDLSWTLKLKLLKDFADASSTTTKAIETTKSMRRVGLEALVMANPEEAGNILQDRKDKSIYINNALAEKDPSEYIRDSLNNKEIVKDTTFVTENKDGDSEHIFRQATDSRRYIRNENGHFIKSRKDPKYFPRHRLRNDKHRSNMSSKMGRRQVADVVNVNPAADSPDDEENMRMKLFRLMYETVRDSDLKVKRAELIKTHYHNSSAFEIGYLMGDITDKYNIIQDIASTLQRLYHEWKPLEHINAYEQIANQAIQISHLIDMMRHINKRNSTI